MDYVPVKDLVVADTLSRAYLANTSTPEIATSDITRRPVYVYLVFKMVRSTLPMI